MKYLFHMGRNKELAIAELGAVLGFDSLIEIFGEYLVVESDLDLDQKFFDRLGSFVSLNRLMVREKEKEGFEELIVSDIGERDSKVTFCIFSNFLNNKDSFQILKTIKKELKKSGVATRFIEKPSTASILGSGFMKGKVDAYSIIKSKDEIRVMKMIAVQNIDSYTERDYEKPYRDAKLGMLPPKLAQAMINLSGGESIYDPFCGTGTVLIEGLLMGKKVRGSDILERNIEGSLRNISSFGDKYSADDFFVRDATKLTSSDLEGVDTIVTEGYLGKPKTGREGIRELNDDMREVENIYAGFLKALDRSNSLEPMSVVLSFPMFKGLKNSFENLVAKLGVSNYSVSALIPAGNRLGVPEMKYYVYKRSDQHVYRQIVKLVHNPG